MGRRTPGIRHRTTYSPTRGTAPHVRLLRHLLLPLVAVLTSVLATGSAIALNANPAAEAPSPVPASAAENRERSEPDCVVKGTDASGTTSGFPAEAEPNDKGEVAEGERCEARRQNRTSSSPLPGPAVRAHCVCGCEASTTPLPLVDAPRAPGATSAEAGGVRSSHLPILFQVFRC